MLIKQFNGMNVEINKQYELILAFHAVYLLKHPEDREILDFVETPDVDYVKELEGLIKPDDYPELEKYIMNFTDCGVPEHIAIGMNDKYEIDDNKTKLDYFIEDIEYGTVYGFAEEIQKLASDVNWDSFFENHKKTYEEFVSKVCNFPDDLDLNDIEKYYSKKENSYTYVPSMLINGGFGPSDKYDNLYYFRGFYFNDETKEFESDNEYLVECLFHEFSHPIVNPLVDKYLSNNKDLEKLFNIAKDNGLFKVYSNIKESLMYEYLVRANAYILASKYFKDIEPIENDWVIEHGFTYLPDLVYFTSENLTKYKNYEEFVEKAIPQFMSLCIEKSKVINKNS